MIGLGIAKGGKAVAPLADDLIKWLGPNANKVYNKAGDLILMSKDKLRRIRFDFKRPHPHKNPHGHVEELINGKWNKSGPIYPKDVPHN